MRSIDRSTSNFIAFDVAVSCGAGASYRNLADAYSYLYCSTRQSLFPLLCRVPFDCRVTSRLELSLVEPTGRCPSCAVRIMDADTYWEIGCQCSTMVIELLPAPTDAISRVDFSPGSDENLLLATSWDGVVRVYDVETKSLRYKRQLGSALLDGCFVGDGSMVAAGGLGPQLTFIDVARDSVTPVECMHTSAIRRVRHHELTRMVVTGSWDGTANGWDPRTSGCIGTMHVPGKVFCLALTSDKAVIGDSKKKISVFDLRNFSRPIVTKDNVLRFQLRHLECMPSEEGFAVTSTEGRVAYEYFDAAATTAAKAAVGGNAAPRKNFSFKCHREKVGDKEVVNPINALAFHKGFGTFATGGGEGCVMVWDGIGQKRVFKFPAYSDSVASLSFNTPGNMLAVGVSYDYSKGPKEEEGLTHRIFVEDVSEENVKPKAKGPKGASAAAAAAASATDTAKRQSNGGQGGVTDAGVATESAFDTKME
eukprot:GHVU01192029.1.p1 GENE.GHVU01192029.1~~GHVU01192029.1.p1  ORF type:complete len:479 (+),score=61.85 GHVU01192029.1:42-1478(+)